MPASTFQPPVKSALPAPTLTVVSLVIVAAYAAALASAAISGGFLYDEAGRPIASDFIGVWSAGRLALEGHAADAYDWMVLKRVQIGGTGAPFDGSFGWNYPPTFLFVATPLALLGPVAGHLAYMAATVPAYLAAIRAILPRRGAVFAALAFPAAFWNFGIGQNGFLMAALFGGALALLGRRPIVAGVLFGLMTVKPQFGVLIPIALIAGGCWRAIASAAATAISLAAASALVFGVEAWTAFLGSIATTNQKVLATGGVDFAELLSLYGVTRWLGADLTVAWAAQGALVVALSVVVWFVWRSAASEATKSALLVAAAVMASPYAFIYDQMLLAVAIAFLARQPLSDAERGLLGVALLVLFGGPISQTPAAALAAPILAGLAFARFRAEGRGRSEPVL